MTYDQRLVGGEGTKSPALQPWGDSGSKLINIQPERILVLMLKRVGEILVTTPAIRALRRSYPKAQITAVTDRSYEHVLSGNDNIDNLVLLDPADSPLAFLKSVVQFRKMRFDITIDFLANPRSALISLFSGAPVRIGLKRRHRRFAYNHYIPYSPDVNPFVADQRLNAVRLLNLDTDGISMDFAIDSATEARGLRLLAENGITPGERYITISPVSLRRWKLWPFQQYAKVVEYLIEEKGIQVILVCGPGEYNLLKEVSNLVKSEAPPAIEFHELKVLGSVLKQAWLHIGNDGGIKHLASAVGTPTIIIFGPGNVLKWHENDSRHIGLWKELDCRAARCYRKCRYEYKCLDLITLSEMKAAINPLLKRLEHNHSSDPS